jgi:hypothetical protein
MLCLGDECTKSSHINLKYRFCDFCLSVFCIHPVHTQFTEASENSKREDSEEATKAFMETSSVLDPVLEQLSKLHTDLMLQERIRELFHFIDEDMSGLIDFDEMRNGFKRLDCDPPIDFTRENFESEILSRGLALQGDIMDIQCFKTYVNLQLKEFVQKCMARAAGEVKPDEKLKIILRSLQQTAMVTCASQVRILKQTLPLDSESFQEAMILEATLPSVLIFLFRCGFNFIA